MDKFKDRLKELRIDKGISQLELSQGTGLSQAAIALWENGKRVPNANVVIVLAKYFNVTADYLLGLED
ncbi:MAG: helix-turn-helix transcriptional regulator [Clostridia bacterium]|nr:helix-turn-helix transcriptional regulator [Clostridia bacterium]